MAESRPIDGDQRVQGHNAQSGVKAALLRRAVELLQLSAGGGPLPEFLGSLGSDVPASSLPEIATPVRADEHFVPLGAAADAPPITRAEFTRQQEHVIERVAAGLDGLFRSSNTHAMGRRATGPHDQQPQARAPFGLVLPPPIWAPIMNPPSGEDLQSFTPEVVPTPLRSQVAGASDLLLRKSSLTENSNRKEDVFVRYGEHRVDPIELHATGSPQQPTSGSEYGFTGHVQDGPVSRISSNPARQPGPRQERSNSNARPAFAVQVTLAVTNIDQQVTAAFAKLKSSLLLDVKQLISSELHQSNVWQSAQRRAILGG